MSGEVDEEELRKKNGGSLSKEVPCCEILLLEVSNHLPASLTSPELSFFVPGLEEPGEGGFALSLEGTLEEVRESCGSGLSSPYLRFPGE